MATAAMQRPGISVSKEDTRYDAMTTRENGVRSYYDTARKEYIRDQENKKDTMEFLAKKKRKYFLGPK